jgi:4-hydroxybenzoyl-CoA thioesterase
MARYAATVKVRFGEVDRAGIVYYPRYFHFFHIAFEEFFADRAGIPYHVLIERERIGFPTVRAECDYLSPIRFGDRLEIGISVTRIGRSSVTFRYRLRNRTRRRAAAEARITVVCVDMDDFRPKRIPARYRRVFDRHLEPGPVSLGAARRIG